MPWIKRPTPPLIIVPSLEPAPPVYDEEGWAKKEKEYWHRYYLYHNSIKFEEAKASGKVKTLTEWLNLKDLP